MTVQLPTFRLTVAERMEAYRERLKERIDVELQRRGENHVDLAAALKISPRTAERWLSGEREPQRQHRKPLADYLGLPIEELWPDLEVREKNVLAQLDRIEKKLDELLKRTKRAGDEGRRLPPKEPPSRPKPRPTSPSESEPRSRRGGKRSAS